MKRFVVLYTQA